MTTSLLFHHLPNPFQHPIAVYFVAFLENTTRRPS
jgi:hypothetical protein